MQAWWRRHYIITALALLSLAIILYYVAEVLWARHQTRTLVNDWLSRDIITLKPKELSKRQLEILIKVQDPSFYSHSGVTFTAPGTGWTTLTQSVVKFLYFNPFKPGIRKIKQTLIARFALHPLSTKEEQLTLFINILWFDEGVHGLRPAAKHFFQKDVTELSEREFISLVAMFNAPKNYNIKERPKTNAARVARIKKMLSGEYKLKSLFDTEYDRES